MLFLCFKKNQNGFTLIELVASLVVLIAILQTFLFISSSVNSSSLLRDSLIAANLAQEGIEVVRNIRDRDSLMENSFGASLPDGSWRVQWNSASLLALGGDPPLKKDPVSKFFNYDTGTDTIFRRTINIFTVSPNEIRVISTVEWDVKSSSKSTSAESHLFNWYRP